MRNDESLSLRFACQGWIAWVHGHFRPAVYKLTLEVTRFTVTGSKRCPNKFVQEFKFKLESTSKWKYCLTDVRLRPAYIHRGSRFSRLKTEMNQRRVTWLHDVIGWHTVTSLNVSRVKDDVSEFRQLLADIVLSSKRCCFRLPYSTVTSRLLSWLLQQQQLRTMKSDVSSMLGAEICALKTDKPRTKNIKGVNFVSGLHTSCDIDYISRKYYCASSCVFFVFQQLTWIDAALFAAG